MQIVDRFVRNRGVRLRFSGYGVSGYRSYGAELALLSPLRKINLLAGQNNSGKSNVLRVAQHLLKSTTDVITELDLPLGSTREQELALRLAVAIPRDLEESIFSAFNVNYGMQQLAKAAFENKAMALTGQNGPIWFVFRASGTVGNQLRWDFDREWIAKIAATSAGEWNQLSLNLTSSSSSETSANVSNVLRRLEVLSQLPPVKTIEAFRQIKIDETQSNFTPDGSALIPSLAKLERPNATNQADKKKFDAINTLLQSVLSDDSAHLEISRDPEEILVGRGGQVLPLEHLGTGVHQIVMLAAAATLFDGFLLCVEEPEVHLHPLLQRKLVRYLSEKTTNTYLIATHSAHLLDAARAEIFHIQHTDAGSEITHAASSRALLSICADLGYRPSDLLQANAIIWVEGPSDRIYLRHWLALLAPDLEESIHYSIMFYGGRLLSHLSASDEDVNDFIRLRRLNQHVGIIIDSDKEGPEDVINATKTRVVEELASGDAGFAWVTSGRMIENYVPEQLLRSSFEALSAKHDHYDGTAFAHPFSKDSKVDKVKLAKVVCDRWESGTPWTMDLEAQVATLVRFVRAANGLD